MIRCHRGLAVIGLLVLGVLGAAAQSGKVESVLDMAEFVHDWQISEQFTLDVANTMPADLYSFKPDPEEMTFGEQMVHIATSNVFRFNQITGVKPPFPLDPSKPPASDKDTAVKMLQQSFDYVLDVLPNITPEQLKRTWHIASWKGRPDPDGRAMIMNMFVHTAHHRAQCEVYMRAKGIKPPGLHVLSTTKGQRSLQLFSTNAAVKTVTDRNGKDDGNRVSRLARAGSR